MGDLRGISFLGMPLLPPQPQPLLPPQPQPQQSTVVPNRPMDPSLGMLSQQYLDYGNYAFKRDIDLINRLAPDDPDLAKETQLPIFYRDNINPMTGMTNQMLADILVGTGFPQEKLPDYFAGEPSETGTDTNIPPGYYDQPYWGDVPLPKPKPGRW
jgi:hypothetical protein